MTKTYKNIQVEIIKNTLNIQLNRSEKKSITQAERFRID